MSISTTSRGGKWYLVIATTGGRDSNVPGQHGFKAETIEQYWTGSGWSKAVDEALSFATQSDALGYRRAHDSEMRAGES